MRVQRLIFTASFLAASTGAAFLSAGEDLVPVQQPLILRAAIKPLPPQPLGTTLTNSPDQATIDKKALEAVGLKADDTAGILKYLKNRTLNDNELDKLKAIIKRFGDEDFEERIKASVEIEQFGERAIETLKKASTDDTNPPEVIFRAKLALRRMEKVPHSEVATAAIRALAGVKNKEIVPVLLGFLPLTDSSQVVDQIQATLIANSEVDGKPDPALLTALKDANPLRRTVAAVALVEGPKFTAEVRLKLITPVVMEVLKTEKDVNFRFAVVRSFVLAGAEKQGVQMLIDLLPDMNRSQIWQAEDFLVQLAGKDAPKARCLKTNDSKEKAKKAWTDWWAKAQDTAKFEPGTIKPRIQGRFHILSVTYNGVQNSQITEYGPDEKERWKLGGLGMPMDIAFLPNGRILVADQNQSAIVERDMNGKVLSTKRFEFDNPAGGGKMATQPKGFQVLDDGGILVFGANALVIYDKDGKETTKYVRPAVVNFNNHDICAACKLKNGEIIVNVLNNGPNGQAPQFIFLDAKGKELKDRAIKTGQGNNYMGSITEIEPGKVLLTEINQLVEYDLKTGKAGWKKQMNQPRSIQRLPNGNLLYVDYNIYPPRIVEQTAEGEEAWSFSLKDPSGNTQVMKAFIR